MKQIKLSELKIGDKMIDSDPSPYGYFTNRVVKEINFTKSGRIRMIYTFDYKTTSGELTTGHQIKYSNGALSPDSLITIQ